MKKCIKCNKEKVDSGFYASWSHWCDECIDKRKRKIEYEMFIKNGGIDGKEGLMPMKLE